jgi:hydroxymethylbilane synthase
LFGHDKHSLKEVKEINKTRCATGSGAAGRMVNWSSFMARCALHPNLGKTLFVKASVPSKLIIASRESRLAMWQAEDVRARLSLLYPQCSIEILGMTTRGDQILDRTLSKVGGKGLFVKELELALADGRADLAVHSLKDVPMELPEGFKLVATLEREDARDAFVSSQYQSLAQLPAGAVVGTSSLRRQALIAARYPHLQILPLRGNLDTRLAKLDRGEYAAIILASAGLKRLGLAQRIASHLSIEDSLPAAGQGAMAVEVFERGQDWLPLLDALNHAPSELATRAERTVSRVLGGSCQIPLAAYATLEGDGADGAESSLRLRAMVVSPDGQQSVSADMVGAASEPEALGRLVAEALLAQGAQAILAQIALA